MDTLITIKLPLKAAQNNSENKSDIISEVWKIIERWTEKHPDMKEKGFHILWDNYLDIHGKGLLNASREWIDLYSEVKAITLGAKK